MRPIHQRLPPRVRAHLFLCLLAYDVEWELRRCWTPLLFAEEDGEGARQERDPVAAAEPTESVQQQKKTKQTASGLEVQSFRSLLARFYDADTVLNHFDLLGRWLGLHGRPLALYTDRHSLFEPQDKGGAVPDAETQFGRARRELDIELIRARSPQAKERVERSFGTAQDRVVKEMRLAKVKTIAQANALLDDGRLAKHNRLFSVPPREAGDAHRALGTAFHLAALLSLQQQRTVANDYRVRFENRIYQLDKPIYPGQRQGKVVIEVRLDGTIAIRFGKHYLKYHEIVAAAGALGALPPRPPDV